MSRGEQIAWDAPLDANEETASEKIGTVRVEDSVTYGRRKYVYVQNADDAVTISQYDAVSWDIASYMKAVTSDASDSTPNLPAGVCLDTINPSYHGWCLVAGYAPNINQNGGGDIAKDDLLIMSSTNGRVDAITGAATVTAVILGVADAADGGTFTCSGYVRCGDAV